jgi:sugar phosphate isomerase/epimerase
METDRMMYSRRDFGRLVTSGLPLALMLRARADSKINGVQIGAITYSFRTMTNPDDIIAAYKTIGLSEAELMSNHAEALAGAPPGPAFGGGRGRGQQMTEEQRAAAEKARQERAEQMRQWRTSVSMDKFKDVRKKFNDAGVVRLLCYNMNVNNTKDDEIEYAFQLAKALSVKAITTSTQVSMAKRLAPFADKHQLMVGFHGHDQTDRPDEVSTEETFKTVMAASKYLGANLDIGHFTAANGDPVAFIEKYHDRITDLHLKDRKKNHGENVPWGQGDTPIKPVLQLLKDKKYDIPANIEFEYGGDPVAEVGKCLDYCRQALA